MNTSNILPGFIGFCQDKIQGHSSTFQGQNFKIQELFKSIDVQINRPFNIFASVEDKCIQIYPTNLLIWGVPKDCALPDEI